MSEAIQDWLKLTLALDAQQVDAVEQLLWSLGAVSVTLIDAADQPIHEPDPGQAPLWSRVQLEALFPIDIDRDRVLLTLLTSIEPDQAGLPVIETLTGQHWTRAWMDRFEPMQFGHDLWVCPSHQTPNPEWPVVLTLDPGLAFGSGTHPTTALCLEWIADHRRNQGHCQGLSVIDYGCGSGILAIAAALKGAEQVLAIDHDPQALLATEDNARRNRVSDRIRVALPSAVKPGPADLVLANILAGPLIELAPMLAELVKPGGSIVLSGILAEQADGVAQAYSRLLQPVEQVLREEWVRLVFLNPAG